MNVSEKAELLHMISTLRDEGYTVVLIEHDMKLVMNVCDTITVLNHGKKIAEGVPRMVRNHPDVIAAYLGKGVTSVLELVDASARYNGTQVLHGVSLTVEPGEITTIIGANGAGKTTTLKCIMGILRPFEGRILWHGRDMTLLGTREIVKSGITMVPEGRHVFRT